jgi:O-antigen ligase
LNPFTGWGANSFASLYSVFQPVELSEVSDKAHNTYLELAFDLGIPMAVALVGAVVWIVVRCLRGVAERRKMRELSALGFCASVAVGVHALFDFSLQIPGFVVVYAAVLGAAWAQSWSSRRHAS